LLTELKVDNLKIRKPGIDDKVETKTDGSSSRPVYRVTGMLTGNNELVVPGGRYSLRDRGRIADWIKQLRESGPPSDDAAKSQPFGLTRKQFVAVHDDLAREVDFSTKDMPPLDAIGKIAERLQVPLVVDPVTNEIKACEPNRDDLRGLSSGTTLAYLLRPAGLVLVPRFDKKTKRISYVVGKPSADDKPWPVGWPPDAKVAELIPDVMAYANEIEIDENPLSGTMEAIGERLSTPILYDYVSLARQGLDPKTIKVTFVARNLWYGKIIDRILFQCKLKGEWRVDEAGKPLLWITTQLKKAK
jgi:hypothetical protein